MMEIVSNSARFSRADETAIDCVISISGEQLPFTATAGDDSTAWAWSILISGEAGDIAPYVAPEPVEPVAVDIDVERDRRISAGFTFAGRLYQGRPEDRENIAGAALAALAAMTAGAEEGDLRWHGGDNDFVWIAADNSLTPMDAQTMFAFAQAAMAHKQAHIFAARALKDATQIPVNFADDGYWP